MKDIKSKSIWIVFEALLGTDLISIDLGALSTGDAAAWPGTFPRGSAICQGSKTSQVFNYGVKAEISKSLNMN